ncbi:MFS transporter [Ochrobactrum anthropi]|uniref:MFS transporter n=1 Tax=Brucella anthropi TaxID=529 RepID=UPI0019524293|nr:MFS transporter [Brucella anthropi]MBM6395271.1 MFS transporter [Brucella anthropi]
MDAATIKGPFEITAAPPPRGALASLSFAILLSSLGTSIANVALPTFMLAFGASFQNVQWIVVAYLLALTSLSVIAGRLGDIFGRKRLLLSGFLLFSAASLLCGFATTLPWLIGARLAQGAGAAILMAMAMALAADIAPKEKAGSMMGLLGTMSAAGTALGPVLGGLLISWLNWQAIFLAAAPAGALGLVLAHRFIPGGNPSSRKAPPFDVAGGVVLVMTLAAYALAMTGQKAGLVVHPGILLGAALALSALFVLVEKRAAAPLISVETLRTPLLGSGLAMSALVSTVMMATLVVGPFYLAYALGLGAAATGLVLAAGPVVAATTGFFGGKLVDRYGPRLITAGGLAAVAAGSGALAALPIAAGVTGYLAAMVTMTAGYALFQAANNTAVLTGMAPDRRGLASGLLNLSRNFGLVTGASVLGAIFAHSAGTADIGAADPATLSAAMRLTFGIAAGLGSVALAIGVLVRRMPQKSVCEPR